jgi:hypothetical protein
LTSASLNEIAAGRRNLGCTVENLQEKRGTRVTTVETKPVPAGSLPVGDEKPMVVVDLGKQSKKKVKRLRQGSGRLMEQVSETLEELQAAGEIAADHQIVVVVVKQETSKNGLFW